jgi:hypothetical protein
MKLITITGEVSPINCIYFLFNKSYKKGKFKEYL